MELARLLLRAGAAVDRKNANGDTPLHICATLGLASFVDVLINDVHPPALNSSKPQRADPCVADAYDNSPLMKAAENGHIGVVRYGNAAESGTNTAAPRATSS